MDVTFDRIVEVSVILGVAFLHPDITWALLLLSVSIIISMTIFLTVGAVSEKQGMKSFIIRRDWPKERKALSYSAS